jgi:hypothetical protein
MREADEVLRGYRQVRIPTVQAAVVRLERLRAHGPTPAFTFRTPLRAPRGEPVRRDDDWFCRT